MKNAREIEVWVQQQIATAMGVYAREVEVEATFEQIGLDSVSSLELAGALEEWLGKRLDPKLLNGKRTIRGLAVELAQVP